MTDISQILHTLNTSASVELLHLRNREMIIEFLAKIFLDKQGAISSEYIHTQLADFLEEHENETDEEFEINAFDTFETKAKKYIQKWADRGFLTNYHDEQGEVFYEISSNSRKTLDWLASLKKEEFVGTESKFNNILKQLKELPQ